MLKREFLCIGGIHGVAGKLRLCGDIVGKVVRTLKASSNLKSLEFCKTRSSLLFVAGIEKPKVMSSCFAR